MMKLIIVTMKINENESNDKETESNIELQTSETSIEQTISSEQSDDMGDESGETELDYFPKIENIGNMQIYKVIRIVLMKLLMLKTCVI